MDFFEYISSFPHSALVVWFFVTGSIFGSFANVLIHRTLRMIQYEEEREGFSEYPAEGGPDPAGPTVPKHSPADGRHSAKQPASPDSREDRLIQNPSEADTREFSSMSLKGMVTDRMEQHFQMIGFLLSVFVQKPLWALYRAVLSLKTGFFHLLSLVFRPSGAREKDGAPRDKDGAVSAVAGRAERHKPLKNRLAGEEDNGKGRAGRNSKNNPLNGESAGEGFPLDLMGHSRCPHCDYKIPFHLNVPVLSWFFLRGRCRNCRGKISFRYPLVEFLTACLFAGLFALIGWKWFLLEALILVFGLIVVSFIDLKKMILPSFFTLPGVYIGLAGGFFNPERAFSSAVLGWLFGGFILWLSGYMYFQMRGREGMGDGDVSLMGWIGAVLGWRSIAFVLTFSCCLGVLAGMWLIFGKKRSAGTPFPFGPCLAAGAALYLLLSFSFPELLQVFFPAGVS